MLVIVDMQNQILDEENEAYVPDSAALVKRIAKRLEQARANGEYILHTRDIPIEVKGTPDEEAACALSQNLSLSKMKKSSRNTITVFHLKS